MTNSSLENYTMIPIFANKDIQKSTVVNIFCSHCFIIIFLVKECNETIYRSQDLLFCITKLHYSCKILENNNPEFTKTSI